MTLYQAAQMTLPVTIMQMLQLMMAGVIILTNGLIVMVGVHVKKIALVIAADLQK